MSKVISVEHLSKTYRLGQIGAGTLAEDLKVWWAKKNGKPNPLLKIGQTDYGNRDSETVWALRDVSFGVQQGEVLGIIGRNGAGKSTLLKILSRITAPSSGVVKVKGRIASLLEVGTGFHPDLTGRENIYLNGAILGMSQSDVKRKFDEIVDFAEVEKFIDTPVKRYSSGMYVRLAFAVAAHLEPEILIVDEVLAVGDSGFQKKCLGKMSDVADAGRTILFVSHNMQAVLKLCSRSVLISCGQIISSGPTNEIVYQYLEEAMALNEEANFLPFYEYPDTELSFRKVRILDHNGKPTAYIDATKEFTVELYYQVRKRIEAAQIALTLWNSEGQCVFETTDLDDPSIEIDRTLENGNYKAVCNIPSAFIRPGKYTIDLASSIPGVRMLDLRTGCIAFEAVDHGTSVSRLSQGRRGVVSPILEWYNEKLQYESDK